MRSGTEIAEQIRRKAAETAKQEVIALNDDEFNKLVKLACPHMVIIPIKDNSGFPDCVINRTFEGCTECWKKATGRK